jgi:hypothetical protein
MNDLLISAILIISIATMSAAMGMMFAAIQANPRREESGPVVKEGDRDQFPGRRQGGGSRGFVEPAEGDDDFPA